MSWEKSPGVSSGSASASQSSAPANAPSVARASFLGDRTIRKHLLESYNQAKAQLQTAMEQNHSSQVLLDQVEKAFEAGVEVEALQPGEAHHDVHAGRGFIQYFCVSVVQRLCQRTQRMVLPNLYFILGHVAIIATSLANYLSTSFPGLLAPTALSLYFLVL